MAAAPGAVATDVALHFAAAGAVAGHRLANFAEFKFFSGLRPSETTALRWADVDLEGDHVHVHRAIVRGLEKNTTKTNTARYVLLNSRARAAFVRQRALTQLAGDFVFLDPRYGTPWMEELAFRCSDWAPALSAAGLRYRRPYNTRHSYATMMLMSGMTPAFCATQLGHSVGMLLSTYARWPLGHSALAGTAANSLQTRLLDAAQLRGAREFIALMLARGVHAHRFQRLGLDLCARLAGALVGLLRTLRLRRHDAVAAFAGGCPAGGAGAAQFSAHFSTGDG